MEEQNPFDQFDTQKEEESNNPFDQFDQPSMGETEGPDFNFQIEPGFQEDIARRREQSVIDTQSRENDTVRSYSDLYESTINKYPERIRKMYEARTGNTTPGSPFDMPLMIASEEDENQLDQLESELQDVYNQAGEEGTWKPFGIPIKARFQTKRINNPDFDPNKPEDETNPSMIDKKYFVSPPDQSAIMRMSYQVLNNVVAGLGDLATGNITSEGPVSKMIPDMVPNSAAEDFTTEVASLVVGPEIIKGAVKGTAEGVKMASRMGRGTSLAKKTSELLSPEAQATIKNTYATVLKNTGSAQKALKAANSVARTSIVGLGYGLADASIMENNSEGLVASVIGTETIKDVFGVDDRRALDIANIVDTPIINGVVGMFGGISMAISERVVKPGVGGLRNLKPLGIDLGNIIGNTPGTSINQMDAGLKTLTWIDPNINKSMNGNPGAPVEEFVFRTKMLGDSLERYAKRNIQLAGAGKEVGLDTPSAFLPAAEDYYRLAYASKKDVMGPEAFEKWVQEQATQSANRMYELKTALAGTPEVSAKQAGSASSVDDLMTEASNQFSPTGVLPDAQTQAAQKLVQSESDIVGGVNRDLQTFETQASEAKSAFDNALQENPTLQNLIDEANLVDNLGSNKQINDRLAKELPEPLYQSYKTLKTSSDEAYKSIANSGADADVGSFLEAIKNVPGATDADGTLIDPFLKNIAEQVQRDDSFGNLYNNINNEINKRIKTLKSGDEGYRQGLFDLKRNIKEDQINFLISNGDNDVAQMAKQANDAYIKLKTSFGDSLTTRQIEQLGRARLAGENLPAGVGPGQGVTDFNIGSNKIIRDSLEGPTGNEALQSIRRAAEAGGKGGEVNKALVDYYSSQALKNIANMSMKGSTPSVKSFRNEIKNLTTTLENLDSPIIKDLQKIDSDLAKLESQKNISEEQLKAFREQVKDVYDHSVNSAVAKFIYKYNPKYASSAKPISNPEKVLDEIFSSKESTNDIQSLIERAATLGDEGNVIKDAIKGSYLDYTRRKIFGRKNLGMAEVTKDGTFKSGFGVNDKNIDQFFNSPQNMRNLEVIFQDQPEVINQLKDVVNITKNLTATSKRSAKDILGTVPPELDPALGTNTMITLIWGVLNPTATRLRRFTGPASIQSLEQVRAIREATLVGMINDPTEFSRIIKQSADQAQWDIAVREMRELLTRSGVKASINEEEETNPQRSKIDEEMNNLK